MRTNLLLLFFVFEMLLAKGQVNAKLADIPTYRSTVTDTFFGAPVPDPYRWLEDLQTDEVADWVKKEKILTQSEEEKIYNDIQNVAAETFGYEGGWKGIAVRNGGYYFGHGNGKLYYKKDYADSWHTACSFSQFGQVKNANVESCTISPDEKYGAVCLSEAESDWQTIRVVNINTQFTTKDKLNWVKFSSIWWWRDGFFYARYPQPADDKINLKENTGQQLCYHKLGDKQEEDEVIYTEPEKSDFALRYQITDSGSYLVIHSTAKIRGKWNCFVAYKDLNAGLQEEFNTIIIEPVDSGWGRYKVIDFINNKFVVSTIRGANNGRVLLLDKDIANKAEVLIPEWNETLTSVRPAGGKLLCLYSGIGYNRLVGFDYQGKPLCNLKFDTGVTIDGFWGAPTDTFVFYFQKGFYCPPIAFRFNLNTFKSENHGTTVIQYQAQRYMTELVNYKSKDGTLVPMYLTHRKDLVLKGNHPVILSAISGFNAQNKPDFVYTNILFFDNAGILAVPLIRGNPDLGEQWYRNGTHLKKQNAIDDFISGAEFLINAGYTSKQHLAINTSGGILGGAMLTQRPDLFSVAVEYAGVYDLYRYHLFTGGHYWREEYGQSTDATDFAVLRSLSPLQNLKNNIDYPATLIITPQNQDRLPPLHAYKFLATLQYFNKGNNPHLLYFTKSKGYYGADSMNDYLRSVAFNLTFMFKQFKLPLNTKF